MGKKKVNENIGPRTAPARRAVILMNRIKHRPKSVPIQTDNEVVVQVRGDFDDAVQKLKKIFKSKGKDTTVGNFRTYEWKLKGLGFMSVLQREPNTFMSVRFVNVPGLGIKEEPEEEETPIPQPVVPAVVKETEPDLDAVLLE